MRSSRNDSVENLVYPSLVDVQLSRLFQYDSEYYHKEYNALH